MTVSTVNNKSNQIANGSNTNFVFTFHTLIETDIKIYLDDVLQSTSEYTVTLNADQEVAPGGLVVMDAAPALNVVVTILRDMTAMQSTVYTAYDPFPAKSHEAALDKVTLITQQNINALEDVVKAPPSDDGDTDYTMPAFNGGKAIMWDDPTKQLINSSSNFNDIVPDAAASAAAALVSEINAATSEANAATSALDADATLKDFETKYLGPYATPPVVDNEGNPLVVGALYWNTVSNTTLSWNGSAWENIATIIGIADGATGPVLTLTDTSSSSIVDTFVGKAANDLSVDGVQLISSGHIGATRNGIVGYFNRTTTDGEIVQFRQANVPVGNIGADAGDLTVNGVDGIKFDVSGGASDLYIDSAGRIRVNGAANRAQINIALSIDNGGSKFEWQNGAALELSNNSFAFGGEVAKITLNTSSGGFNNGAIIHVEGSGAVNRGELVFSTGWTAGNLAIEKLRLLNSGIIMLGMPTSAGGLPAGHLWNNSGVVNIV